MNLSLTSRQADILLKALDRAKGSLPFDERTQFATLEAEVIKQRKQEAKKW
jgi:hypothetical protein